MGAQFCPVGRLEKLLFATDRSEYSEGALQEALNFAGLCSSRLHVMSVIETNPEYETTGANYFEKEEAEALKYLGSIKDKATQKGIVCETVLHSSINPSATIVDEAIDKNIDMIILGRHGRKGLLKALMGEVVPKVIVNAPCKVLVVPKAARIEYRNILVATDGSGHSVAAVEEAINIAKRCGSKILALSSIRSNDELEKAKKNVNAVLDMAKKEGVEAEGLTPTGRSHDVIVETAGGRGVDLIIMGIPVKTAISKIFSGSATEKVVGNAGCSVLVVKGEGSVSATV
ncbi:MAG TPA: universal stress protein [Dissulfurispiraceae bacterium]|nr:universal stress protein [Dissulfurispiraceae bacterium]